MLESLEYERGGIMFSKTKKLFCKKETVLEAYWRGRGEGWFACENMIVTRIKKYHPDIQDKLIQDLVQ